MGFRALVGLMLCGALAGCVTPADIQQQPSPMPRMVAADMPPKPVQLRRVVIRMAHGTELGAASGGYLCVPRGTLKYTGSGTNDINDNRFTDTFREELKKANYVLAGNPDDLFEEPGESGAELVIAGVVTDIKLNGCMYPTGETKGESALVVEWQIYNKVDRQVVHKVVTRGTGRTDTASLGGSGFAVQAAFAQATRGLLADEGFHRLVTGGKREAETVADGPAFQLFPRERVANPIATRITEIQSGVVTVLGPRGHGSGFVVSTDGYVLTNRHVVGDARSVRLRLATGREVAGAVVASNARRDVALIRVNETGFTALPLAREELPIGSDVYALGSPFTERLAATLTRGIVSGYRSINGMRFVQSDVSVQPGNSGGPLTDASGNVVGLTVFGVASRGVAVGLNFFVPIDDALSSVGIDRAEAKAATATRMVQLTPTPAPAAVAAAPAARQSPAAAPPKIVFDGDYQTTIPANVFADLSPFPLTISVRGSTITGSAAARSIGKSDHICRVTGTLGSDDTVRMDLMCSAMSVDTLKMAQIEGRFIVDAARGNAKIAETSYRTNDGYGGVLTWVGITEQPVVIASAAPVAAAPAVQAGFDGTYRALITEMVFPEMANFEMLATVYGTTITGSGNAREVATRANSFSDYTCRVAGWINGAGDASMDLSCTGVGGVKTAHMRGRFVRDPSQGNVMIAQMQYTTSEGRGGLLTWAQ